jgi:hypothetical protein
VARLLTRSVRRDCVALEATFVELERSIVLKGKRGTGVRWRGGRVGDGGWKV